MRVCEKMVIYLGIKTPQSRKGHKYTWQNNARISCSRNDCKYAWEKTARISCHNFETNGRPYSSNVRCRFLEHFFLALSCFGSGGGGLASTGRSASASLPELSSSRHAAWPNFADFPSSGDLGCVHTDATLLTNNSQHCWMLRVASVCTSCSMSLCVVGSFCAKFETGQTFHPTTPNISFVP